MQYNFINNLQREAEDWGAPMNWYNEYLHQRDLKEHAQKLCTERLDQIQSLQKQLDQFKQPYLPKWVTPTEVPERALFLNWRTKEHKTPVLFDMWSPSRNTLLMRDVSGDPEEMEMSDVEYLEPTPTTVSSTENK